MKNKFTVISISVFMIIATLMSCNEQKKSASAPAIDPANLDKTVVPGNDFDTYANGGWKKLNPLPADRGRYGSFDKLAELAEKQVNDLVTTTAAASNAKGSVGDKIATLFNSGMDTAKIEKQGLEFISPYLKEIDEISTPDGVQLALIRFHQYGISPLFGLYGSADSRNSTMVIAQLTQAGMGMPDRDYYLNEDPRSVDLRAKYLTYMTTMFKLIGNDEATSASNAQKVMTLETRLAKAAMSRLERRDPNKTYNKVTTDELNKLSPVFNWNRYFTDMGIGNPGSVNLNQPEFIKEISNMLSTISVEEWKIYLKWNLINETASYLSANFVQANFDFYGKAMTGTEVMRPRWKRVLGVTSGALSEALGQLYVKAYFPQEAKDRMVKLVSNLRIALGERIQNLEWMSPETKQKALEKLATINVKIGYPDKWRDYSGLEIKDEAYVLNVLRANKFETEFYLAKINKPVDRLEWGMSPQTVNAYYSPDLNEIVFPAAILQPPFFFKDGDDAVNYGAIGVVIGHEMSHGFDDQGRKFDKVGNLTDWWTPEDSKRFDERTKVLVDQYNSFVVLDSIHANGQLSLGENIADLGGLNISHTAFLKANTQKELIDGFTPEQRFFLAYAHVWGQNTRDKEILRRTKEDVHSLGRFRVLGPLQNLPEFYAAFDVKEGQSMYLAPDKRAKIW
ncbi:MAG: M13 family metallopeptidase [Prolixibacteraceae bacterium]